MALQSNADLRLLNGLLPVISINRSDFRSHILDFVSVDFFRGGVVSPTSNPQAPSTHFSRLLRYAWATVGLLFPPVTTRGCQVLLE